MEKVDQSGPTFRFRQQLHSQRILRHINFLLFVIQQYGIFFHIWIICFAKVWRANYTFSKRKITYISHLFKNIFKDLMNRSK